MVDLDVLRAFGVSTESFKAVFDRPREEWTGKQKALMDRIRSRVQGGRDFNLERSRIFKALDDAWDTAFQQITPTMLSQMCDKSPDDKQVIEILDQLGASLNDVLVEIPDPKTPGKSQKRVSAPAFFKITVPLCMAYVKIRMAKIVNDRKSIPFMKFWPEIADTISRARTEMVTQRIRVMDEQYNHFETFKQAVFNTLHYSETMMFPLEEWHSETQWLPDAAPFQKTESEEENEKTIDGEKFKLVVVKEGLRYHFPHPSRAFRDQAFPGSTLNTDTGCEYAGYWSVLRWGTVKNRTGYYNLERVGYSDFLSWHNSTGKNYDYWVNATKGCSLTFPEEFSGTAPQNDSEKHLTKWYSKDWDDQPVVLTEYFERVVPSEWDLGDYDRPIWIRFVVAADDTIVYAAPVGYDPAVIYWGYDTIAGRTQNPSMTLELLPFQDQYSNLLSQHLLTVRQNLMNLTFINTDLIKEKDIAEMENWGERMFRKINLVRVSFTDMWRKMAGIPNGDPTRGAVIGHRLPFQDTTQLLNAMRVILDTLERVMVISSQEAGQAASHEQTKEEVRRVASNTSVRVAFTAISIDSSINYWKKQIYNALMTYGELSFYAQVPMEEPMDQETLDKLKFTAATKWDERTRKMGLKAKDKTAVMYESFVSDRDGPERVDEIESGKMMLQMLQSALQNPTLAAAIGPDQALKWMNMIGKGFGFPRDFRLENTGQTQSQAEEIQQVLLQMRQYIDQALAASKQDTQNAMKNIMEKNVQQDNALATLSKRLNDFLGGVPVLPESSDTQNPAQVPASPDQLRSLQMTP